MPRAQHRHRIIPLHGPDAQRPHLVRVMPEDAADPREPILHPAAAEAVKEQATPPPPVIGFWNGVPVREELLVHKDNPLTWAIMQARKDRMKAYLPIIEVTTMLMLTVLGVLLEHFALMIFGDWK